MESKLREKRGQWNSYKLEEMSKRSSLVLEGLAQFFSLLHVLLIFTNIGLLWWWSTAVNRHKTIALTAHDTTNNHLMVGR